MRGLRRDLHTAIRGLRRRPAFTTLAVATLALGIGAHATLFSVVRGVLMVPLQLPRADRLASVQMRVRGELEPISGPNLRDLIEATTDVFSAMAGVSGSSAVIENPDGSRETRAGVGATFGIFDVLGEPLQLGRPWSPEAEGTGQVSVVVLTDRLWRGAFGADSSLVGRTIVLDGSPVRVAGVTAPGSTIPSFEAAEFIHPLATRPAELRRELGVFDVLSRLREGVALDRAQARVAGAWEDLRDAYPAEIEDAGIVVMGLQAYVTRDVRPGLLALLGATGLLLLLACANVSGLLLAQGVGRRAEMATRASLGASRWMLSNQLLLEAAVLAAMASTVGLAAATGTLSALRVVAPPGLRGLDDVRLEAGSLGLSVVAALLCAALSSLLPTLRGSRASLAQLSRSGAGRATGGRRERRGQRVLVVGQIATAVLLSVTAGLLLRSFGALSAVDPGYRTDGVLTASIAVPGEVFYGEPNARTAHFERAEREVAALPSVRAVGHTLRPPFSSGRLEFPVRLPDAPEGSEAVAPRLELGIVSGGYLEALRVPVVRGRGFTPEDRPGSPRVVLVSERAARTLFGTEDAVGRRLAPVLGAWEDATRWAEVVGVVGDVRLEGLDAEARGTVYLSLLQQPQPFGTMVVRADGPMPLPAAIRETLLRIEPRLPVPSIRTLAATRAEALAGPRFRALLIATLAAAALALAGVGVFGLLSHAVASRRVELGVRAALGADRIRLVAGVLRDAVLLTAMGLALGLTGAVLAARWVEGLLFGVPPTDPFSYGATALGVAGVALAGSVLPALRAARVEVIEALGGRSAEARTGR